MRTGLCIYAYYMYNNLFSFMPNFGRRMASILQLTSAKVVGVGLSPALPFLELPPADWVNVSGED